ncbi:MAG: YlxR family protein [Chloroflexota bacterium]
MKTDNKRLPTRTCIACRESKPKQELIRLVCTESGVVEVDPSGKKNGRGAYLCRKAGCWEMGLKGGKLGHFLRTNLSEANRDELIGYVTKVLVKELS